MRWILTVAVVAWATSAAAQIANPDFEIGPDGAAPPGWALGAPGDSYSFTTVSGGAFAGEKSVHFTRRQAGGAGPSFGVATQPIDITALRGHRVRYSAAAKVVGGAAMLWVRVDGADGRPALLENMAANPIRGQDWRVYAIEAYVGQDAKAAYLGFIVRGSGDAFFDSASLVDLGPADPALSPEAKAYLDRAISLLKQYHLRSASADWDELERRAYRQAAAARTPGETHTAIRMVIESLGERHSALVPPPPSVPVSKKTGGSEASLQPAEPLPTGRMAGRVAIISLPSWHAPNPDGQAAGNRYQDAITTFEKSADSQGACGWIVDLRNHAGGDMWPGIRGLGPLLGQGPYGAFVSNGKRETWRIAADLKLAAGDAPVAVLLGPQTGSAGEFIAVALSGRPGARTFGQPTKGLTTANRTELLADGAKLLISAATVEDRTGRAINGPLIPEVITAPDGSEAAAKAWLGERGCV